MGRRGGYGCFAGRMVGEDLFYADWEDAACLLADDDGAPFVPAFLCAAIRS